MFIVWGTAQSAVFSATIASAFILSLLLVERSEIRPELFGWFYFAILSSIFIMRKPHKYIYTIPVILLLWVNSHITFVFGCYLTFLTFIFNAFSAKKLSRQVLIATLLSIGAIFINPNGVKGALYPLFIFGNYGYPIVENQSLLFLNGMMSNPGIRLFLLLQPLILIVFGYTIWKKHIKIILLTLPFYILTWLQIRHMPFFAISFIPALSITLSALIVKINNKYKTGLSILLVGSIILCIFLFVTNWYWHTFDYPREFGYGLEEYGKGATDFMKAHNLPPQIFNGFDIGGYAAYALFPQYRLFMDNRPESYPAEFVSNTYIALQQNKNLREKVFNKYHIHTILFNHTDGTPWGEQFMKHIITDKKWKTVYADSYAVVLTDIDTSLPDVAKDDHYLSNIIFTTSDYLKLISVAKFMSLLGKHELAIAAFRKAQQINPISCGINKYMYNQLTNSPYFDNAIEIRSQYWYCF